MTIPQLSALLQGRRTPYFVSGCILILLSLMNPFAVVLGQTTLDHFSWAPLPASAQVGNSFPAMLQAVDLNGNPVA
ncbi:hypothetical protein, partial [Pedosphaera parvula]